MATTTQTARGTSIVGSLEQPCADHERDQQRQPPHRLEEGRPVCSKSVPASRRAQHADAQRREQRPHPGGKRRADALRDCHEQVHVYALCSIVHASAYGAGRIRQCILTRADRFAGGGHRIVTGGARSPCEGRCREGQAPDHKPRDRALRGPVRETHAPDALVGDAGPDGDHRAARGDLARRRAARHVLLPARDLRGHHHADRERVLRERSSVRARPRASTRRRRASSR